MSTPGRPPTTPADAHSTEGDPRHPGHGAWPTAIAGLVVLAVAMGIGRFAFTPILPLMLGEGRLDLPAAGWLASVNYLGYLAGALACTLQPWWAPRLGLGRDVDGTRWLRVGLVATGVLTLAMALPWAWLWPVWRFAAGVASAVTFVYTAGWCLGRLAQLGAPALGGVMFAGPGAGIVGSGLVASGMLAFAWPAAGAWLVFGLLAFGLAAWVWPRLGTPADAGATTQPTATPPPVSSPAAVAVDADDDAGVRARRFQLGWLTLAYGLAGFGYIITATFLPVIARQALPGSAWIDLFWPIFGAAVVAGALLTTRLPAAGDPRLRLALAYAMQAGGILCSLVWPSLPGFILGSLLLGLPFTAITLFALQELRRLRPPSQASATGLVTTAYGIGQILGPALAAELLRRDAAAGFDRSLGVALLALLVGTGLYLVLRRVYPVAAAR